MDTISKSDRNKVLTVSAIHIPSGPLIFQTQLPSQLPIIMFTRTYWAVFGKRRAHSSHMNKFNVFSMKPVSMAVKLNEVLATWKWKERKIS